MQAKYPKTQPATTSAPKKTGEPATKKQGAIDLHVLNSWYSAARENHRKKHWEMFVIDQFLRGNHDIKGNPNDNSIEIVRKQDSVNYPINKLFSTFRAVRGFVTRHKPFVLVEPENSSEEARAYARRANKVLERDNLLNNFRKINKEWVYFGVKYGVGYRQVGYDPLKKCTTRWSIDPFDLLTGNKFGEMEEAPYVIKTVTRTIGYIRKKYPQTGKDIAPDNELAADEYKRLSFQITYGQEATAPSVNVEEQTAIIYECWYRLFELNKAGGLINKCTFTTNTVLDFEETPYMEYPFISYKSDIVPNEAMGEGHLKHILSPQRMLNLLNTQLLEHNHINNRGRYITDKNSGFRVIMAKEGQIIFVNPGKRVQVLPPAPISQLLPQQITMAEDYIETIGGQHDASMGAAPERVTSGRAIESLQLGDSNNISDLRDNFEDALALEAQWILKLYSMFEGEGVVMTNRIKDEEEEKFGVVGAIATSKLGKKFKDNKYFIEEEGDYCEVCRILPDNLVKVSVASQLGETREAKMELMFKLLEAGLPLKVILEHLEFPNTSDILERIAQEALAEQALTAAQTQVTAPPPVEAPMEVTPPPQEPQNIPPPPPVEDEELMQLEQLSQEL